MFRGVIAVAAGAQVALAYTSYNSPMAPGNENFPSQDGAFQMELEKGFPTLNIKYRFNQVSQDAAKILAEQEDALAFNRRLQDAYLQAKQDQADLGAAASRISATASAAGAALSRSSFLQDPFSAAIAGAKIEEGATNTANDDISELFHGLAFAARPQKMTQTMASVESITSCDRDYSATCPNGFASQNGVCVATSAYNGPCAGEARDFSKMSLAAKSRWQQQCGAYFPCTKCTRDYSTRCPTGFTEEGSICRPSANYAGPCGATDFSEYNAAMLKKWSDMCGAYWSCTA